MIHWFLTSGNRAQGKLWVLFLRLGTPMKKLDDRPGTGVAVAVTPPVAEALQSINKMLFTNDINTVIHNTA